jgi:hypothetical protein
MIAHDKTRLIGSLRELFAIESGRRREGQDLSQSRRFDSIWYLMILSTGVQFNPDLLDGDPGKGTYH